MRIWIGKIDGKGLYKIAYIGVLGVLKILSHQGGIKGK